MAPKVNAKAAVGRAAKEEVQAGKKAEKNKVAEKKEDAEWAKGEKGKGAKDDKAAKDEETRRKKDELRKLTEAEESATAKVAKPTNKAPKVAKATPKASIASKIPDFNSGGGGEEEIASYSASTIDDMIDVLQLVGEKTDKASMGTKASKIEKNPERHFKAAFEKYKEEQLPIVKNDFPGLRLQQYNDMMFKNFGKSPDNPFNQVTVAYNASKEDKLNALKQSREESSRRLRDN